MLVDLFPEGFEELDLGASVELAVYDVDERRRHRLTDAFGPLTANAVRGDWPDRWREFHHGVRVGALWVGPPWEEPEDDSLAIVIDPGRAFGTGSHPTTRLCLELLQDQLRGSFLDVGCGSGVLAIAAAKLGFGPGVALDADPAAVEATAANAARNGVALEPRAADALVDPLPTADVAVANIELAVIEQVAARLDCDRLITSGYLTADMPSLRGFVHVARVEADGWAADLAQRA